MAIHNLDIKVTNGVTNAVLPTPQSVEVLDLANSVLASGSSLDGNVTIPLDNPPATLKLRLNSNLNIEQEFDWNDADLIVDFILTRVFYRVKATSSYIDSPWSNIAELNLQADQPPIPTLLPLTEEDILVMVAPAVYPQEIHYSGDNGVTYSLLATLPVGTDNYIADGLISGKVYYFKTRTLSIIPSDYSDTTNATTLVDFGLALDFDGVDDRADILGLDTIPIPLDQTFSFWVNTNNSSFNVNRNVFFSVDNTTNSDNLLTLVFNPDYVFLNPTPPGYNLIALVKQGGPFSVDKRKVVYQFPNDNDWHHIAATTKDNGDGTSAFKIYFDAVVVAEQPNEPNERLSTEYGVTSGINAQGDIDEIAIIDRALTLTEIQQIYKDGQGSTFIENDIDKFIYFDFNKVGATAEGDNTLVPDVTILDDQSGNGHDGTFTGLTFNGPTSNYVDSVENGIDILNIEALTENDVLATWDFATIGIPDMAVSIEYDDDPNFGSSTSVNVAEGIGEMILSGLTSNTFYYFRIQGQTMTGWFKVVKDQALYDFGLALSTSALTESVSIGGIASEIIPNEITVAFWMNYYDNTHNISNAGGDWLLGTGGSGINDLYQIRVDYVSGVVASFNIQSRVGGGILNKIVLVDSEFGVFDEQWHRIVINRRVDLIDPLLFEYRLFIDGVELTTINNSAPISNTPLNWGDSQNRLFNSSGSLVAPKIIMDDFQFIEGYVSDADILQDYNNGKGSKVLENNYIQKFYYDFNTDGAIADGANGAYTTITDQSGNGHDGTLNSFTLSGTDSNYVDSVENGIGILTATATSLTEIQLDWDYSLVGLPQIASTIEYDTDPDFGAPSVVNISEGLSSTLITGLTIATKYYFRIQGQTMTGWYKAVESYAFVDPTIFGSNLHAWFDAETVVFDVAPNIAQWTDLSGNGRHLASEDLLKPIAQSNVGSVFGSKNYVANSIGGALVNSTNWAGLGSSPFFEIMVVSATASNQQRYIYALDDGAATLETLVFGSWQGASQRWLSSNIDNSSIRAWAAESIPGGGQVTLKTFRGSNHIIRANNLNATITTNAEGTVTKSFDSIVMFTFPDRLDPAGSLPIYESIFIKGNPEDNTDLVNALYEGYLKPRYPSLNLVAPNIS